MDRVIEAYGEQISEDIEAHDGVWCEGDPAKDPRYDPTRELERLAYQRQAVERSIARTVALSRTHGASWNTIGRALGVTAEAARRRYGKTMAAGM